MAWFYFYKKDKGQYVAVEGNVVKRFKHERGSKDIENDKYYLEFHTPFGFAADLASEEGIVFFNSVWLKDRDDSKAIDILLAHRLKLLESCKKVVRMYPERRAVVEDAIDEHESAIESLRYKGILMMHKL